MNKRELQTLLAERNLYARKEHGQNFLVDGNLRRYVAEQARLDASTVVLEVGTGLGQLTQELVQSAGHVVSVEIDERLLVVARERLASHANLTLVAGDCLRKKSALAEPVTSALREAGAGDFVLAANLPYNCASPLLLALLEAEDPWLSRAVVMVQKEVCQRWEAGPGSKAYGVPSILMQLLARCALLKSVNPSCFWPQPQVVSAIAGIERLPAEQAVPRALYEAVKKLVRSLFCYRRKTLSKASKSARDLPWSKAQVLAAFAAAGIDAKARVETVEVAAFCEVARTLLAG